MNLSDYQMYFVPVALAVILGEILFQSAYHMGYKWRNMWKGYLVCAEHTVLYTAIVLLFLYLFCGVDPLNTNIMVCVGVSHFIFEKFPFSFWWMKYIKCEYNPMFKYFEQKMGTEAVGTEEWYEYILSYPVLEMNEEHLNSSIFYITELIMVNRLLQFTITFTTIVTLDILNYI